MHVDLDDFEFAVTERFPDRFDQGDTVVTATPRQLVDYLAAGLSTSPDGPVVTVRAFCRIRSVLARLLNRDPRTITPRSKLADLMSDLERRRLHWSIVRTAIGVRHTPGLSRPENLQWAIAAIAGTVFLAAVSAAAAMSPVTWLIMPAGVVACGTVLAAVLRWTEPAARYFSQRDLTVGTLARYAVAYGSPLLGRAARPTDRAQIVEVIQALVQLEIGASNVDQDATWEELAASAPVA